MKHSITEEFASSLVFISQRTIQLLFDLFKSFADQWAQPTDLLPSLLLVLRCISDLRRVSSGETAHLC